MGEKEVCLILDQSASFYIYYTYSLVDADPVKLFKQVGSCFKSYSDDFVNLSKAIELENKNGAGIKMKCKFDDGCLQIYFRGNPDALQRLVDADIIEGFTDEDED
ncbi:MAG: hypothetical protein GY839_19365 [candidate division Zixibacteria bacterium]|nr:hypothetical protein [candidate division Zixibacteria bacterium]